MQRVPTDRTYMEAEHGHLSLYVGSFGVLLDEMLEASRAA
jgi:hypothetical protein